MILWSPSRLILRTMQTMKSNLWLTKKMTTLLVGIFSVAILSPSTASATGAMRCGEKLVEQGTTRSEVRQLCGEPTSIEKNGDIWIYDRGPHRLLKIIKFVQDTVEFIDEKQKD